MKVRFFGVYKSLVAWREIVKTATGKACDSIRLSTSRSGSDNFVAYIDEADCGLLMKSWYEVEPGQDMPWNYRVTFRKEK